MKILVEKNNSIITIEREDTSIEEVMDSFISCLLLLDYDTNEIKNHIIKTSEILKKDHHGNNKNVSII